MLVVDANIIVYLKCQASMSALAQTARARDPHWVVPPLWRHEFLNALLHICRQQPLSLPAAMSIWRDTLDGFAPQECLVNMELALQLAMQHGITAYDAQYVALAQELEACLLTEDKELLRTFPAATVSLRAFCNGSHTKAGRA